MTKNEYRARYKWYACRDLHPTDAATYRWACAQLHAYKTGTLNLMPGAVRYLRKCVVLLCGEDVIDARISPSGESYGWWWAVADDEYKKAHKRLLTYVGVPE